MPACTWSRWSIRKLRITGRCRPTRAVVNIDVFDVTPKVDGLHLYADVSRMETDPQGLSVTESYFIRNESKPPKTQLSTHSFEFYLPPGCRARRRDGHRPGRDGGFELAGTDGRQGALRVSSFPLRPGETRFQVGYRLPYSGSATLHARVTLPAENVAVMLPKSMSFDGGKKFSGAGRRGKRPGNADVACD